MAGSIMKTSEFDNSNLQRIHSDIKKELAHSKNQNSRQASIQTDALSGTGQEEL